MVIPKSDDFGQRDFLPLRRLDSANFAQSGNRSFGLNNQADELHHPAANLCQARLAHSLQSGVKPSAPAWNGGFHEEMAAANCSTLTSRRASIRPNLVWTTQPPRVISDEAMNRKGPLSGTPSSTVEPCLRSKARSSP